MSEQGALFHYRALLQAVGARAGETDGRPIASHWPFVGSQFGGTLIVGQALAGWDAEETPARWPVDEATTEAGRTQILDGTRAWAAARAEPMDAVLRWSHRRGSPFWGLSQRLMRILEPDASPWYSRHAWWNVYPLGYDRRGASPFGALRDAQAPHVGPLFWEVVDLLQAKRIVIVAGADWWPDVRQRLGLGHLDPRSSPILAAGRVRDVEIVATYHPGAHIKGLTRDHFAATIADEISRVEPRRAMEAPTLEAEGVLVDQARGDDADAFFGAQDDELRLRFGTGSPRTRQEALEIIEKAQEEWGYQGRFRAWAVRETAPGPLIGWVSLRLTDFGLEGARQHGAFLEFWAAPEARGRGLVPRAVGLVRDWAARHLRRDWIDAEVQADNEASLRVLRRLCFKIIGDGSFHDIPTRRLRFDLKTPRSVTTDSE